MPFPNNLVQNTLLLISSIAITLFVVELCLPYITGIDQRGSSTKRSIVLREMYPNRDVLVSGQIEEVRINKELASVRLRTDQDGFIVGPDYDDSLSNSVDLIFFGGSTTESLYVEDQKRFPFQVAKILSANMGKKISSLNAGVSGNNTMHSTLSLLAKGLERNPNIAVLMHNINDLAVLTRTGSYYEISGSRSLVQSYQANFREFAKITKDLFVPNIYALIRDSIGNQSVTRISNDKNEFRDIENTEMEVGNVSAQFRSALLSFIQICKSWNIEPILMTQMNRINLMDSLFAKSYLGSPNLPLTRKSFVRLHEDFNEVIRKVGMDNNVLVIDLDAELSDNPNYIYDSIHLSNPGSDEAARLIAESLLINVYAES